MPLRVFDIDSNKDEPIHSDQKVIQRVSGKPGALSQRGASPALVIDEQCPAPGIEERQRGFLAESRYRVTLRAMNPRRAHVNAYLSHNHADETSAETGLSTEECAVKLLLTRPLDHEQIQSRVYSIGSSQSDSKETSSGCKVETELYRLHSPQLAQAYDEMPSMVQASVIKTTRHRIRTYVSHPSHGLTTTTTTKQPSNKNKALYYTTRTIEGTKLGTSVVQD